MMTAIKSTSFFQALQAALNKQTVNLNKAPEQIDAAIRQLVSKVITTESQIIDVFTAAGLPKPDISILSDQFLAEVCGLKHKNLVAELLEKLLKGELKVRSKRNLVQNQVFSEKIKQTLNAYYNHAISIMQVIEKTDANTGAVFGDYINLYDIQRAVANKATVPIYYESRISKLSLNAAELPKIDAEFEEITQGEELTKRKNSRRSGPRWKRSWPPIWWRISRSAWRRWTAR